MKHYAILFVFTLVAEGALVAEGVQPPEKLIRAALKSREKSDDGKVENTASSAEVLQDGEVKMVKHTKVSIGGRVSKRDKSWCGNDDERRLWRGSINGKMKAKQVAKMYCVACQFWMGKTTSFPPAKEKCHKVMSKGNGKNSIDVSGNDLNPSSDGPGRRRGTCFKPQLATMPPCGKDAMREWVQSEDAKLVCKCFQKWYATCDEQTRRGSHTKCILDNLCACSACSSFLAQWGCPRGSGSMIQHNDTDASAGSHEDGATDFQNQNKALAHRAVSVQATAKVVNLDSTTTGKCEG